MIITPNAKTMTGLNEFCVEEFVSRQNNPFICALQDLDREKFLRAISNPPSKGEVKIFEIQVKGSNGILHWCICKIKALYESGRSGWLASWMISALSRRRRQSCIFVLPETVSLVFSIKRLLNTW